MHLSPDTRRTNHTPHGRPLSHESRARARLERRARPAHRGETDLAWRLDQGPAPGRPRRGVLGDNERVIDEHTPDGPTRPRALADSQPARPVSPLVPMARSPRQREIHSPEAKELPAPCVCAGHPGAPASPREPQPHAPRLPRASQKKTCACTRPCTRPSRPAPSSSQNTSVCSLRSCLSTMKFTPPPTSRMRLKAGSVVPSGCVSP